MIDWFVVLLPIILLPIVLLFAFVGCVLDREGKFPGGSVRFTYPANMANPDSDNPGLGSIQWTYTLDLDSDFEFGVGQIGGPTTAGPFERGGTSGTGIAPAGETHSHPVHLETFGQVTCHCTLVTSPNPPFDNQTTTINRTAVKPKQEDETGPPFTLSRDASGYKLG